MRYVTTIHLDETSTTDDFIRAANRYFEATADPVGSKGEWVRKLVALMRRMVLEISAPFEMRVGSADNEPLVVVHPRTRAAGLKARQEAIENGHWQTNMYEFRPQRIPGYGKSSSS